MNDSHTVRAKLPAIFVLLHETWGAYWSRFTALIGITLVPFLISGAGSLLIKRGAQGLGLLLLFVGTVLVILSYLALLQAVRDGRGVRDAYRSAIKDFWPYLWIVVLTNVVTVGGYVMLLFPGVIFAVWFFVVPYVFVEEGKRGMDALLAGRSYVRGYGWPVFWRFAVMIVIAVVASYVADALGSLGGETGRAVAQVILSIIFVPLVVVFGHRLYRQVRQAHKTVPPSSNASTRRLFVVSAVLGLLAPIAFVAILTSVFGLSWLEQFAAAAGFSQPPVTSQDISESGSLVHDVQIVPADWKTYRNEKFRFTFSYPPTSFIQGGNRAIGISEKGNSQTALTLNLRYLDAGEFSDDIPKEFSFQDLKTISPEDFVAGVGVSEGIKYDAEKNMFTHFVSNMVPTKTPGGFDMSPWKEDRKMTWRELFDWLDDRFPSIQTVDGQRAYLQRFGFGATYFIFNEARLSLVQVRYTYPDCWPGGGCSTPSYLTDPSIMAIETLIKSIAQTFTLI